MKCPIDGDTMLVTVRMGIEIDFCPACRGLWLDRGELSKIYEREAAAYRGPATLAAEPSDPEPVFPQEETSVPVTRGRGPWENKPRREEDEDADDGKRKRGKGKRKRYDDRDWKRRHETEQVVDSFLRDLFDL